MARATGERGTVLVVDDEPQLLRLVVRVLERAGFAVLQASDGDAALDILAKQIAELKIVILDVIIPPRGAEEVLGRIVEARPELPVVLASGDQLAPELQQRLSAGTGIFLRKPFLPKALLREVEALLG